MARNEKGEATSETVEVLEIPEEEKPKPKKVAEVKPVITKGIQPEVIIVCTTLHLDNILIVVAIIAMLVCR